MQRNVVRKVVGPGLEGWSARLGAGSVMVSMGSWRGRWVRVSGGQEAEKSLWLLGPVQTVARLAEQAGADMRNFGAWKGTVSEVFDSPESQKKLVGFS